MNSVSCLWQPPTSEEAGGWSPHKLIRCPFPLPSTSSLPSLVRNVSPAVFYVAYQRWRRRQRHHLYTLPQDSLFLVRSFDTFYMNLFRKRKAPILCFIEDPWRGHVIPCLRTQYCITIKLSSFRSKQRGLIRKYSQQTSRCDLCRFWDSMR